MKQSKTASGIGSLFTKDPHKSGLFSKINYIYSNDELWLVRNKDRFQLVVNFGAMLTGAGKGGRSC